jgi:DNA invertase Pin-like site-specific DNA recombinase
MRQVLINTESTIRQYALKDRLILLGWDDSMIEVIDCDLGRSGAEAIRRDGFRQMLADVGEGNVGAIACIECSRLSRSSSDWGRLMEICALSETILIDDDGIYNPNDFNDRLLLGLKGTMNEALCS